MTFSKQIITPAVISSFSLDDGMINIDIGGMLFGFQRHTAETAEK